ncbi:rh191 [macacine betaherpesvirus 3]|uniref:Rh191 n=1 Tax=Rhesus cytomegalovirus (strain 68-1) TaxID=47929 RepID=Q7TFF1_RHCM6|nr:rh191 [macacine betaherpesvirus 3]AAP50713.1 rh191 [macacine betaherpesvirus 3]AAZ80709.1 rh191 [macacine betaherpesvirus 3]
MARCCGLHCLEHMGVGDLEYVFGTHRTVAGLCVFPGVGTQLHRVCLCSGLHPPTRTACCCLPGSRPATFLRDRVLSVMDARSEMDSGAHCCHCGPDYTSSAPRHLDGAVL